VVYQILDSEINNNPLQIHQLSISTNNISFLTSDNFRIFGINKGKNMSCVSQSFNNKNQFCSSKIMQERFLYSYKYYSCSSSHYLIKGSNSHRESYIFGKGINSHGQLGMGNAESCGNLLN
jgi:hypothetical protein